MTAKEYLRQVRKADVNIDQRIREKEDLREMATSIGSFNYSKERVQTSPPSSAQYEQLINKMLDLDAEINSLIDSYVDLKHKIIGQIQGLCDVNYIEILNKRYIENKRLEVIAVEMNYDYNYIRHIHGRALQEFEKRYLENSTQKHI